MQPAPLDPMLPGWRIETRSNESGRSWKIYFGPNGERESTRAGALRAAARATAAPPPLPATPGWMQCMTPDGRAYYQNPATGQAQWTPPHIG